jgi:FecR protein
MRSQRSLPLLFAAVSLGAFLAIFAAARADTVGTAGAVNTTSSGTPPGAPTRIIEIGTQVVENEKIQTTATGSVQVLFIDKTTLNVGPNSTLSIDRFVFNPATTKGALAISLSKGVLRVVGGIATHSEGATIRTPTAAIGLRGGIAIISYNAAKGTQAILGFGHMSVTTLCGGASGCSPTTVDVSRPGYSVTVAGFNKPPSSPGRVSSQELALSNAQLTSRSGQSGGASQQPTDVLAQSYNVGTPNSPGAPIIQTASQGRANALTVTNATRQTVQQGAQIGASVGTAQTVIAKILQSQVAPPPPPVTPPPVTPPPVTPPPITPPVTPVPPLTYAMVTSGPFSTSPGSTASPAPYLTGAFAGSGGFTVSSQVSPILGYQSGFNSDGTPSTTSRQFQAGLSVTGKGANQNATLFVMTSAISNAPNIGFTQAGGFTGVTMRNSAGWYGSASGAVSSATPGSAPNSVQTINGIPIASFTLNNTTTNLLTGTVSNSQSSNFVPPATANYTFNPITAGTPTTLANNHPNLSLKGYVGGVMVTALGGSPGAPTNFTNPYVITNFTNQPGDVSILLPGNSSEMVASFHVASVNPPSGAMSSSSYSFGSLNASNNGLNGARGAYVSPSNFAARATTVFDNGANLPVSTRSDPLSPLEQPVGYANQLMVTANSVNANTSSFLTSISSTTVQPCACQTQWGFWSAFNGGKDSSGQPFQDQGALLLWVAGTPTLAGTLPVTGTATYTGHAIASIASSANPGATSYLAAGALSATANFATKMGTVSIIGLDGTNYAGTAVQGAAPVTFAGSLVGNNGGRTATLAGSFFQGTGSTPAYSEIGGSLILNGNNSYLGSGIFLGRKP